MKPKLVFYIFHFLFLVINFRKINLSLFLELELVYISEYATSS